MPSSDQTKSNGPNHTTGIRNNQVFVGGSNNFSILDKFQQIGPFDKEILPTLEMLRVHMKKNPNGWIAMVLIQGLEKTNSNLANSLNTISIVSGLLLTISFSCLISPNDAVLSLDNGDWVKQGYFAGILASIIGYFISIMLNTIFLMNMAVAARESDSLKLFLKLHRIPLISYTLFGLGYMFLICAIALSTSVMFGETSGIIFLVVGVSIGGIFPFALNNMWALKLAHVIQYWQKNDNEDFQKKIEWKINEMQEQHLRMFKTHYDEEKAGERKLD
eukprot:403356097